MANTAAILLELDVNAPAAKGCADYTSPNGKNDWFLPSQDELYEMQKSMVIDNPASGRYWSSSQSPTPADTHARNRLLLTDSLDSNAKDLEFSVRPIRAF